MQNCLTKAGAVGGSSFFYAFYASETPIQLSKSITVHSSRQVQSITAENCRRLPDRGLLTLKVQSVCQCFWMPSGLMAGRCTEKAGKELFNYAALRLPRRPKEYVLIFQRS